MSSQQQYESAPSDDAPSEARAGYATTIASRSQPGSHQKLGNRTSWAVKSRKSAGFITAVVIDTVLVLASFTYMMLALSAISRKNESVDSNFGTHIEEIEKWNLCLMVNASLLYDPMVDFVYAPFSTFTAVLFLLWALNPIGGQSSLRLVHRENTTMTAVHEIRYQETQGPYAVPASLTTIQLREEMYSMALAQPEWVRSGPTDSWGNPKIPRFGVFEEHSINPDEDGWYDVEKMPKGWESWSSFFGLPVIGLAPYNTYRTSFSATYRYTTLRCGRPKVINMTSNGIYFNRYPQGEKLERADVENDANSLKLPGIQVSTVIDHATHMGSKVDCTAHGQVVETQIHCDFGNCRAVKVRDWQRPYHITADVDMMINSAKTITASCNPSETDLVLCPTQLALNGSTKFYTNSLEIPLDLNLSAISSPVLSARLGILWQTAFSAQSLGPALFGSLPYHNLSFYGPPHDFGQIPKLEPGNGLLYNSQFHEYMVEGPMVGASANATVVDEFEVLNPTYAWCLMLLVSSLTLFSLGVGSIYCNFRSLTPNMFDPVVGWTYMNPYLPLPPSSLDDDEYPLAIEKRLKSLGKTTVRLGTPYDQKWIPYRKNKDVIFESYRRSDTGQTDVESPVLDDHPSAFSPIVLGSADMISRLGRKDAYQSPVMSDVFPGARNSESQDGRRQEE